MRGRVIPWLNLTSGLTVALGAAKIGTRHIFDLDSCVVSGPGRPGTVPDYFRRSRKLIKSHTKHFIGPEFVKTLLSQSCSYVFNVASPS